jgi:hypothetical protein
MKKMESKKDELTKAKNIISFMLPTGYEFLSLKKTLPGNDLICIGYENGEDIYITRFPDDKNSDLQLLLTKPSKDTIKMFSDIGINDINLSNIKNMDFDNPELKPESINKLGENIRKFGVITCSVSGKKYEGIIMIVNSAKNKSSFLYIALSLEGRFDPQAAKVFYSNLGE